MSDWDHLRTVGEWDDLKSYEAALEELNAAQSENNAVISEIEHGWQVLQEEEWAAAEASANYEAVAATAYENVQGKIEGLCTAYDDVYQSAMESFSGQFDLFDKASTKSEDYRNATVANAQAAMNSQLAYWESYHAHISVLKDTTAADLGLIDDELGTAQEKYTALMSYVQDGSEQAAGLAASMAAAVESGNTEAVAALANTVAEVTATQSEVAAATADWQTNFSAQMNAIEQEMQETVTAMNLSDEAAASATATINSYVNQIRAGKANAVAAAQDVARAVAAALSSAKTTINVGVSQSSLPGNATGTTDAEDIFVAGEEGPELIVGAEHSTVFPADETNRIIDAVTANNSNRSTNYALSLPETSVGANQNWEQPKHITLEIAGGSPITIRGNSGANKGEIVEILLTNLRPALLQLVKEEIFEEGDGSYEH